MITLDEALNKNDFLVITCGGGKNFTALIWEWYKRGYKKPDLIIFADTGSDRAKTHQHLTVVNNWLFSIGWPQITYCFAQDGKTGQQVKLHEACLKNKTLPPPAFNWKTCSSRFKTEQVDKFLNNYEPARKVWGEYKKLTDIKNKITRVIGFDFGEDHRVGDWSSEKYDVVYPLVEWEMDRDDCIASIAESPLPDPIKSSCWMCPNMKTHEILEMAKSDPDELKKALEVEDAYLASDAAKGRYVETEVLRRIDNKALIGVVADMDKKELNYLLGELETNFEAGGLALDFIQPEPVAYISKENVWQPSHIRGLGRNYSWREVLANPELQVGSDQPCMCNES